MFFLDHPARRWAGWLLAAMVVVAAGGARILAQPADGILRWPAGFSTGGFVVSSPAVGPDGTIYVGVEYDTTPNSGLLLAILPDGSRPKWQAKLPDWGNSSPTVSQDGTVYIGCYDGKLYAFDAGTGKQRWAFDTHSFIADSSPAIGPDGTIYIGSSDAAIHAISPGGTEIWSHPVGDAVDSSPAIAADGTIYFGSSDHNVYAVTPDNVEKWHVTTGAEVISSPAIGADGTVYVGSEDGLLYAIASDGTTKWTFSAAGPIDASPALGPDGTIYFGSYGVANNYFYAVDPAKGTEKWKFSASLKAIFSSAAVRGDGAIVFGGYDRKVYALKPEDGSVKWAYTTGNLIESSPAISPLDGSVYIGSFDGKLYAFNGSGSPVSTFSTWPAFRHDSVHSGRVPAAITGGRLINLSTRGPSGGDANLIVGFVVTGTERKNFLIRGIGPTLGQPPLNVSGALSDPELELHSGAPKIAENDNWGSDGNASQIAAVFDSVGAFALPAGSKDSALVMPLDPGLYTAAVNSVDGTAGIALVEAYDAAAANPSAHLINLSTLARVGGGDNVLIAGLVVGGGGTSAVRVLLRAIGPGLTQFGVSNVLAQPVMTVFDGPVIRASNSGWTTQGLKADLASAFQTVGAFALADDSTDCAVLLTLNSGNYTIQVSGAGGTSGNALIEAYVVP